jgi:hypothetical protein
VYLSRHRYQAGFLSAYAEADIRAAGLLRQSVTAVAPRGQPRP